MKAPTFLHGVIAAAALAFVASAMTGTLTPFLGVGTVLRLAVPVVAAGYLVYFFRSSRQRTGRVVTWSLWTALAVVAWWAAPSLPFYLLVHAGAVWLVRSLYAYSGVIPALMDLGLCALSACAFGWIFLRTGGVFLATWSFFLVQALWVAIPRQIEGRIGARNAKHAPAGGNERFEHAHRQADEALRQLFSR
jgi:hypothetical protein